MPVRTRDLRVENIRPLLPPAILLEELNVALVLPGATRIFVDDILINQFAGWLMPLLVGLAAVLGLQLLLTTAQEALTGQRVTQQYPEEHYVPYPRFRGRHILRRPGDSPFGAWTPVAVVWIWARADLTLLP